MAACGSDECKIKHEIEKLSTEIRDSMAESNIELDDEGTGELREILTEFSKSGNEKEKIKN